MNTISLAMQTMFAELIQRCLDAGFDQDFDERGQFVPVRAKGRAYWYFQRYGNGTRKRHYVGPVAEAEITRRVENFKHIKDDFTERREMVRALTQTLPKPEASSGDVVDALWKAGFFRLRGVLVGSLAFQCYAGLLGVKLSGAAIQTQDVDFAQFKAVSDAVNDTTPPMIEVLQGVDQSFREVPGFGSGPASAFINGHHYRVEFLTSNRDSDDFAGRAADMPALGGVGAQPLRFLDFLIKDPVWSVLLYKGGVPVRIPAPGRYAIHKLILSTRRGDTAIAKANKDVVQASQLILAMDVRQSVELGEAWSLANDRGPKWSAALRRALPRLEDDARECLVEAIEIHRSTLA